MVKQKKRTRITQSGENYAINCTTMACAWFENKRFDWPSVSFFLSFTNQNAWFVTSFGTELTLFCTVLKKNCTALNQSEWRNFFMYIIRYQTSWLGSHFNREEIAKMTFRAFALRRHFPIRLRRWHFERSPFVGTNDEGLPLALTKG